MRKLRIRPLFYKSGEELPNFYRRINDVIELQRINMIIVDGKAQTGKSTLARAIAKKYDKNFILVFTVQELLNYLTYAKNLWFSGRIDEIKGKWIFFDEPQLESPRQEFWSQRNMVIQAFTSSFGFLHNHLIMALPNIKGLSDVVLTNISLRFTIRSFLNTQREIVRKAYIKIPIWVEHKQKFYWTSVQEFKIPEIEPDLEYDKRKAMNFFGTQLDNWNERLKHTNRMKFEPKIKFGIQQYLDFYEAGMIAIDDLRNRLKELNYEENDIELLIKREMKKKEKMLMKQRPKIKIGEDGKPIYL